MANSLVWVCGSSFLERTLQISHSTCIADVASDRTNLGIERGTASAFIGEGKCALIAFHRRMRHATGIERIADFLVDPRDVGIAMQCLRGFARLFQELERLIEREYAFGDIRRAVGVGKRPWKVTGLHEVVREVLRMLVHPRPCRLAALHGCVMKRLQRFANSLMQAAAANRIQLLIEHFPDFVVS